MNPSQLRVYLASKPLDRMRVLAALLGWRGLQLLYHVCPADEMPSEKELVVIFYMTTDEKFNLQINEYPLGQSRTHRATVKAERYGIVHTEWMEFELPDHPHSLADVVKRLRPLIHRSNFKNRRWIRAVKQSECIRLLPAKKKQRGGKRRRGAK